jgi:hypothetical protein
MFDELHFTGAFAHLEKEHVQANLPGGTTKSIMTNHKRSKAEVSGLFTVADVSESYRSSTKLALCFS